MRGSLRARTGSPPWSGRLVLLPAAVCYAGPGGAASAHAHHAVQLVWAVEGRVTLTLPSGVARVRAALIPSQLGHALDVDASRFVMCLVERHAALGLALDVRAREAAGADLGDVVSAFGAPDSGAPASTLSAWATAMLHGVAGAVAPHDPMSPAVRRVVRAIERGEIDGLEAAADAARVSPTRLTHRFTREVGIPFRRFVLWARLRRAVLAVQGGADLTRAAVDAGFSDSAHFSRTFRETIGLAPSRVLPRLEIVGAPRRRAP